MQRSDARCANCSREYQKHWIGQDGAFCASADLPDPKLFAPVVSTVQFREQVPTELEFLRELEQDVQRIRTYANNARIYTRGSHGAQSAYDLTNILRTKINHRIVDLLGKQAEAPDTREPEHACEQEGYICP